ncbi:hypothetical protein LEP1GSC024_0848 [Leptospira noguchii str. 2001034031]|uniref:Uncharacterized protein n=1 Tax=Leptospira noguchii str. 2001034031 TaxID=1193053 RepID=M6Y7X3_9LEPT|nr:hypothetical protein LEP1GSC024_0848 [Leptospira noguchii str. 2001034031]
MWAILALTQASLLFILIANSSFVVFFRSFNVDSVKAISKSDKSSLWMFSINFISVRFSGFICSTFLIIAGIVSLFRN